jgi:hypothetical protein
MQDSFLLAYKGLIGYAEPLRITNSVVKINTQQFVHWRTFQWHWDTLADLIDYLPDTLTNFQVKINFNFMPFFEFFFLEFCYSTNSVRRYNSRYYFID